MADTLLVKRSDSCRHAVANASQNSIQFIRVLENSPVDTRAQSRVDEAKVRAIRAIESEPAEGKAKVLSCTASCADLSDEALHDQLGTVVSRRVGTDDLERHVLGGISGIQVSSKPDGGEPSMPELVDDAICIAEDVAEVHRMIATLLIVDDFFEFEGRKLEHEPVILPVLSDLSSLLGGVGAGHRDTIAGFGESKMSVAKRPGDLGG